MVEGGGGGGGGPKVVDRYMMGNKGRERRWRKTKEGTEGDQKERGLCWM